jgi:hypothetical protein
MQQQTVLCVLVVSLFPSLHPPPNIVFHVWLYVTTALCCHIVHDIIFATHSTKLASKVYSATVARQLPFSVRVYFHYQVALHIFKHVY